MALLGGIGGGVTHDALLNVVPAALTNPAYITLSVIFGFIGYHLAYNEAQLFREGFFQLLTVFSLTWYSVAAAEKAAAEALPAVGILLVAVVCATAGRRACRVVTHNPNLLLGRNLHDRSHRERQDLGLAVEAQPPAAQPGHE
ncbi:TRIC cation channel family protein [Catellatospora sp. TT07R-123]|uniref:TRIC cation channel family protein n=1 Tax=Catellatospora sp. TT07R-123 TaxID=2733863 RepID=UPI001FD299B8|nr:TRIC cation channel family protein [Catellatospora sp. TT07R-123]